ncbi:hypothetical protein EMIT0111MI5_100022 [Burkholderia sp. IT-111MI5]
MVCVGESFRFLRIGLGRGRCAAALRRKVVLRRIDGNPVQPRVERRFAAKLRQRTVRLDERVLGYILDLGGIPHEARDQPNDLAVVFGDQEFERCLVALLYALDQNLINFFFTHLTNPLTRDATWSAIVAFPHRPLVTVGNRAAVMPAPPRPRFSPARTAR